MNSASDAWQWSHSAAFQLAVLTGKGFPFFDATSEREWKWAGVPRQWFLIAGWVSEEAEFVPVGFSVWYVFVWLREAELKPGRVTVVQLFKDFSRPEVPNCPEAQRQES